MNDEDEHKHRKYCLIIIIALLVAFIAYSVAQNAQDTKLDVPIDPCLTTQYLSNPNGTNTTCNSIPFNAATTFYLHNDSNGFSYNSKVMNSTLNLSSGFSYTNVTSLATGNVLVQNWTSPALNVLNIPTGVHLVHLHAIKSGGNVNRVIKLFYECGSVNSTGGNLSIRATSELSEDLIESTVTEIDMDMLMPAEQFNLTDRMIIRVWANSTGGGAAPNIQLLFDDNTDSRLALPTTAVDTSNFVTYTGATSDVNLGTHNISAASITTTGTNSGTYPNNTLFDHFESGKVNKSGEDMTGPLTITDMAFPTTGSLLNLDFKSGWNRNLSFGIDTGTNTPFVQSNNSAGTVATNFYINPYGGTVFLGFPSFGTRTTSNNITITTKSGASCITMKSPDGTLYRFTIANGGTVNIAAGSCG